MKLVNEKRSVGFILSRQKQAKNKDSAAGDARRAPRCRQRYTVRRLSSFAIN